VDDVERISWGKPAKKKGTGSRGVPHRLNMEERFLFDSARKKGFLEIDGSGWRSQRREAPLLNTYRSLCDARGQISIVLHKSRSGLQDEIVCDLSPLRYPNTFDDVAQKCIEEIQTGGQIVFQGSTTNNSNDDHDGLSSSDDNSENDDVEDAAINGGEDLFMTLSIVDGTIKNKVSKNGSSNNADVNNEDDDDLGPWETRPIYQLPPYCISWELQRNEAKMLGKLLAKTFSTIEGKNKVASSKRKPIGVKHGKGRRHGGYGIG